MSIAKACLCLLVILCSVFGAVCQTVVKREEKVVKLDIDDDDAFSPHLEKPAFPKDGPLVVLDEAHGNNHFNKALARLIAADGFHVVSSGDELTFERLANTRILIIMNAGMFMPRKWHDAPSPLFSDREAAAIRDWIVAGGSLLFASGSAREEAGQMLLERIGVQFYDTYVVDRGLTMPPPPSSSCGGILFSREKNTLGDHKIVNGRAEGERLDSICFNGVNGIRKAPENAVTLVHYSEKALLIPRDALMERRLAEEAKQLGSNGKTETAVATSPLTVNSPVPKSPVAVAFTLGKGRVVVMGSGSAISAVTVKRDPPGGAAPIVQKVGLGEGDNQKFTLNVMHWLAGLLD
jgi:hypothetical protein